MAIVQYPNGSYNVYKDAQGNTHYDRVTAGSSSARTTTSSSRVQASTSNSSITELDSYVRQRFDEMINKYMPGWSGVLSAGTGALSTFLSSTLPTLMAGEKATYDALKRTGAQYLSGQLPADVTAAVRRSAGARQIPGQLGSNLTARDLGLTSVDMQSRGATFLDEASKIASNISNLSASAQNQVGVYTEVAKTLSNVTGLSPDLLVSLENSANALAADKYRTDLAAQTAAAARDAEMKRFTASQQQDLYTLKLGLANSAFNQQMGIRESAQTSALLNPSAAPSYIYNANNLNRQLTDFTNKLLKGSTSVSNLI